MHTIQHVLITGGAGFIGSHTVEYLLQQGKSVCVLDNLSSGTLDHLPLQHQHLQYIKGDILDLPLLTKLVAAADAILHLAAIASITQSIDDPLSSLQTNTLGFVHLLDIIRQLNQPIRLVYASSAAVYGDQQGQVSTDLDPLASPGQHGSPYALQKLHCEHYASLYNKLYGIPSLGLRYFNVYGPRQQPTSAYAGVISHFMHAYRNQQPCLIFGDGQQSRDFIHVWDVARANHLALSSEYTGMLNIATGQQHTVLDLIHYIERAGGEKLSYQFSTPRAGDIYHSYATIGQAAKQLGFHYAITLDHGITRMCQQTEERPLIYE